MRERTVARNTPECSKRPSSKAAANEGARRTLRYVERLSEARTPLEDFFSILLEDDKIVAVNDFLIFLGTELFLNDGCLEAFHPG